MILHTQDWCLSQWKVPKLATQTTSILRKNILLPDSQKKYFNDKSFGIEVAEISSIYFSVKIFKQKINEPIRKYDEERRQLLKVRDVNIKNL